MTEAEFLERWLADRPMYEEWGFHVVEQIVSHLSSRIAPLSADVFLRLPAKPRVKGDVSIVEKAFYRKQYADPYNQITDKVGVRFVVLLTSDMHVVEKAIQSCNDWDCSKDRDYEQEQQDNPIQFDYAAVHYVVRCREEITRGDVLIAAGTPCEVQVKTILQHAYSELTHDTIYKPKVIATPLMRRTAAKSMALIEATNDYFQQVVAQVGESTSSSRKLTDDLGAIYRTWVGREPELTRTEGLILEAFEAEAGDNVAARVSALKADKNYIGGRVAEKANTKLLYRQPSILLVYLLASEKPAKTKLRWPLTPDELRPIYVDLGKAFDNL